MARPLRIYAGDRLKGLRTRLGLTQAGLAGTLGISVSYLSQIESGDRPMTPPVIVALTRCFPADWAIIVPQDEATLLARAVDAGGDPSVPEGILSASAVARGMEQHPALLRRIVALHEAVRRSQEQVRVLDDRFETGQSDVGPMPWEEVRDWFHTAQNYVDAIDRRAERIAEGFDPEHRFREFAGRLKDRFGVGVGPLRPDSPMQRTFDAERGLLAIDTALPPETTLFSLANQLARLEFAELLDAIARRDIASEAGRALLLAGLANYAAGALLMPYGRFRDAALRHRHDIDRLRRSFGTSFEQTCHRLSTLQRPGAPGVPFFFCRVDMAGNITKRHSATRLQFARFGGACPLWIVHEAVAVPDRILVQLSQTPDGLRYVSMAKGLVKQSGGYDRPPRRYAVALGCEVDHAPDFVYADGLRTGAVATPIGASCRICPRQACEQRAFPPAGSEITVDPDRRGPVPYSFR